MPFSLRGGIIRLTITESTLCIVKELTDWNLKLLVIYAIEKSKSRLGSLVRNILLTFKPENHIFQFNYTAPR